MVVDRGQMVAGSDRIVTYVVGDVMTVLHVPLQPALVGPDPPPAHRAWYQPCGVGGLWDESPTTHWLTGTHACGCAVTVGVRCAVTVWVPCVLAQCAGAVTVLAVMTCAMRV